MTISTINPKTVAFSGFLCRTHVISIAAGVAIYDGSSIVYRNLLVDGLISTIRRSWTLRGHEVRVPYKTTYQWGYVYGALEFVTGSAEFLYTPTVSLDCSQLHLEQLMATQPEAIHIVIWDRAGFHQKADQHELPEQIRLLPLPPYCPELSPIEKLWDPVKREVSNVT